MRAVLVWLADRPAIWLTGGKTLSCISKNWHSSAVLNVSCWAEGPSTVPLHPSHCLQSPRKDHFPVVNPAIKMQKAVWPLRQAACAHRRERPTTALRVNALMETQGRCNLLNKWFRETRFSLNAVQHSYDKGKSGQGWIIKLPAPAPKCCPDWLERRLIGFCDKEQFSTGRRQSWECYFRRLTKPAVRF